MSLQVDCGFAIVRAFGIPRRPHCGVGKHRPIGEFCYLDGLGAGLTSCPMRPYLIRRRHSLEIVNRPVTAVDGDATIKKSDDDAAAALEKERERQREDHVILIGYGTVGRLVAQGTRNVGRALVVIEDQPDIARRALEDGLEVVIGNATDHHVLAEAGIERASKMLIAIPEGFEGGAIAERARQLNPGLVIIARAHSDEEVTHLERLGANHVVMGEREIATQVLKLAASVR